jgi:hypothetical protein
MFSTKFRATMIAALAALSVAAVPAVAEAKVETLGPTGGSDASPAECQGYADVINGLLSGPRGTKGVRAEVALGVARHAASRCIMY